MKQKGLGAGLSAILGDRAMEEQSSDFLYLPLSKVEANADQPRKQFDEVALQELAQSIREHGLVSPITVRRLPTGYYQIVAGERRWRASRLAGLQEVPCRIVDVDDKEAMEISLIENLQREDLNPLEEAEGYQRLMEEFGLTQEETANRVGVSRPAVANAIRLLGLGKEIKEFLEQGTLSAGHARALLKLKNLDHQLNLAQKVIQEGLSVRQVEKQADQWAAEKAPAPVKPKPFVDYTREVEERLTKCLGRKVKIVAGKKGGRLELDYYDSDDLEAVIDALGSLKLGEGIH